jgi:RNA polymerase sigma-70 factor (ECF subfamily)
MSDVLSREDLANLVNRACGGDSQAREALLSRWRTRLLDRVRLMMGDAARAAAESSDFAQEAFLRLQQREAGLEFQDEEHLIRWLTHVARNLIRDKVRAHRGVLFDRFCEASGVLALPERTPTPTQEIMVEEARDTVLGCLLELPPEYRQVIELRHFEELPFAAIARAMSRTENAVQLLHTRALTRLGRLLERKQ